MSTPLPMWWPVSNNFGDLIGKYVAEKITGRRVMYTDPNADYPYYVVGGSVLNHVNAHAITWGCGLGTITDGVNPSCRIAAVRGPITRARVLSTGRECPAVYGDPGMLLPRFYDPKGKAKRAYGLVAHYADQYRAFDRYRDFIDVFQPIEQVVDEICSCEMIYSTSLHGIIVAHAYGIPATWIKISDSVGGDGTKLRDYFASVNWEFSYGHPIDLREQKELPSPSKAAPDLRVYADNFMRACPLPQ